MAASTVSLLHAGAFLQKAVSTTSVSRDTSCLTASTTPPAVKADGIPVFPRAYLTQVRQRHLQFVVETLVFAL